MFSLLIALCSFALVGKVVSESSTDLGFLPCPRDDSHCFTTVARALFTRIMKRSKTLENERLDPFYIKEIDGTFADIHYTLKNSSVQGFAKCKIDKAELAQDSTEATFKLHCPDLKLSGQYSVNGSILELPLDKQGNYKIEINGFEITVIGDIESIKGDNGEKYISFTNLTFIPNLSKKIDFEVENLFDGELKFAEPVLQSMRTNLKPIIKLLQMPSINQYYANILEILNKYIKNIPVKYMIAV